MSAFGGQFEPPRHPRRKRVRRAVTHQNLDGGPCLLVALLGRPLRAIRNRLVPLREVSQPLSESQVEDAPRSGGGSSVIHRSLDDDGAGFAGGPAWQVITFNKEQVTALEGVFSACFGTASGRRAKMRGVVVVHYPVGPDLLVAAVWQVTAWSHGR